MDFIPLTAEQQRSFDDHGFIVVRNAIDVDTVDRLIAVGDRFMETAGPFRNWHRDLNNFAANHPIRGTVAVRAGYCLSDFTEPYSGMTRLVPGSHRLVEQLQIPQGSLDPTDSVELALQPGDAYLFSTSCYHFPALNFQRHTAKGLLVSYAYRWWTSRHPRPAAELLETMDPIARQLYGDAPEDEEQLPLRHWAREHGLPSAEIPPMRVFV